MPAGILDHMEKRLVNTISYLKSLILNKKVSPGGTSDFMILGMKIIKSLLIMVFI